MDSAFERERLIARESKNVAIKRVILAMEDHGPNPVHHYKIFTRHQDEWPSLHGALQGLREAIREGR